MTTKSTTAYDIAIYGLVRELMETEGLDVEEARERLLGEVDKVCDEIIYGGDDE